MTKSYCTQPEVADCLECSLTNYSRDCKNNPVQRIGLAAFTSEMCRAKTMQDTIEPARAEYWSGYQRGLRRAFHGSKFGSLCEHMVWLKLSESDDYTNQERGAGYRAGLLAGGASDE